MKYSSLLFVAVMAVTASYTQAVSKAVNDNAIIGENIANASSFFNVKLYVGSDTQNVNASENKSPRKPKKFKKKSHSYNKKRGKRK